MTTYFGLWKVEPSIAPQDPRMAMQLYSAFQSKVKRDIDSGLVKESNSFLEGNAGYFITGDITEEKLHELLLNYTPYLTFEVHRTIPVFKTLENLIAISRERAAALKVPA